MAENKLSLQIITPTRAVLNIQVDNVVLRTLEGDMGVYYDHEPVVTLLGYGVLRYKVGGKLHKVTTMGGFAEITQDRVVVLTDASELEEEIDFERAKAAKERAEGRLGQNDLDISRAQIALHKALVRLDMQKK
ncbi:MAG: F0F1 ATP synthase subunit epsilon [Niameybacter sp.]|uniref:F0F1 ATP synthase subunit epsilon n=1 Tax=Niameybacter sp. TaxID=2033640 RepID=UPI002FCC370B